MRIIQVGLGDFGFGWLEYLLSRQDIVEIAGVVEKNPDTLLKVKEVLGLDENILFSDLRNALLRGKPDFILNITPPKAHKEVDLIAFENKIPVLSEKPIAESYTDALEIAEKSAEDNIPIMIAENYRFSNISREVKKLLSSGEIGNITSIHVDFLRNHRMNNYHKDLMHPLLLDVTIHHVDMIRYFTGVEAEYVWARSWIPEWSWYKGYSCLDMLLEMEKCIRVSYRGSLCSHKNESDWYGNWRLEGEKGIMRISDGVIRVLKDDNEIQIRVNEEFSTKERVLEEFINSLKANRAGETDIADNMKTFKTVLAAMESIGKKELIKIFEER